MGDPVARLNTEDRIMPAMRSDPGQENLTSGITRIEGFMNGFDNMNRDQQVHARIFPGAKPSFCAISDLKDISGMFRRSRMKAAESCIHGIQRIAFTLSDFDCAILAMFNETAIDLVASTKCEIRISAKGSRLGEILINHRVIRGIQETAIAAPPLPVINEGRTDAPQRTATV